MDIPDCMATEAIRPVTTDDDHLSMLSEYILHGWPSLRPEEQNDLQPNPVSIQGKALIQLPINQMNIVTQYCWHANPSTGATCMQP